MMLSDCGPQIHLVAYHTRETNAVTGKQYNNDTPGIGIFCELNSDVNLLAGSYYNSVKRTSNYAAVSWQPFKINSIRIGAIAGAVTGYGTKGDTQTLIAGAITYPIGPLNLNLAIVPAVENVGPGAAGLSVSFKF